MKKVMVKKNRYVDSVSLMSVSDRVMTLKVVGGFDVVERLNGVDCHERLVGGTMKFYTPKEPQRMKKVWVDTLGVEYEPPKTKQPSEKFKEEEKEIDAVIDWV